MSITAINDLSGQRDLIVSSISDFQTKLAPILIEGFQKELISESDYQNNDQKYCQESMSGKSFLNVFFIAPKVVDSYRSFLSPEIATILKFKILILSSTLLSWLIVYTICRSYLSLSLRLTIRILWILNRFTKSFTLMIVVNAVILATVPLTLLSATFNFTFFLIIKILSIHWSYIISLFTPYDAGYVSTIIGLAIYDIVINLFYPILAGSLLQIVDFDSLVSLQSFLFLFVISLYISFIVNISLLKATIYGLVSTEIFSISYIQAVINWALLFDILFAIFFIIINLILLLIKKSTLIRSLSANIAEKMSEANR